MDKKIIDWFLGSSWSPDQLSPLAYWDNGSSFMASNASSWTDRIGGYSLSSSGSGHSRATGINGRLKLVNTASGYWVGPRITSMQNASAVTIWTVGNGLTAYHGNPADTLARTQFNHFVSDTNFYGVICGGGSLKYGYYSAGVAANYYAVMIYDGSQTGNANRLKIWVNGIARTLTFVDTIPATTENSASSVVQVGRAVTTTIASDNYEIGFVNRAITSNELTNLNTFLANRYAL